MRYLNYKQLREQLLYHLHEFVIIRLSPSTLININHDITPDTIIV